MYHYVTLKKEDFNEFIKRLAEISKVTAPVKRGLKNFAFEEVTSGENVSLAYIPTILPPKKYFMPQAERLIEYNKSENKWEVVLKSEKLIIFGVRTCDLAGIQCLNMVFSEAPKDVNYLARRDNITIISFECNFYCDEYASCHIVDNHVPKGGYDLFFTELKDLYMVHINTEVAESIIKNTKIFDEVNDVNFKELEALREKKNEIFKDEVNSNYKELKLIFDKSFEAKIWDDLDKRCVACGNCTNVCPTCYCFDVIDDINLDLNTGVRYRKWDSCQNEEFAKIAGGESFRKTRSQRQRHRYMRKFKYSVDKYNKYFCTGCGRCTRACMAGISLKETINSLAEEAK